MEAKIPLKVVAREDLCIEKMPRRSCGVVIFGASGDLSRRKLIPAFYELHIAGLLPQHYFLLGTARSKGLDDQSFRQEILSDILKANSRHDEAKTKEFLANLYFLSCDYSDAASLRELKIKVESLEKKHETGGSVLYYLSTPPDAYSPIIRALKKSDLIRPASEGHRATNVVFEKPFGHDLRSSRDLDQQIREALDESQIYRIDHYLGKETVQNIMMFRFANMIFEPIWNRRYIDHIQITAAETLGVGHRAGYYESAGVLRDMFQNHMMQLLTLVAMEAPASLTADQFRDEKTKVLRTLRPIPADQIDRFVVRGQYGPGTVEGEAVAGYTSEKGVGPDSSTETFVAMKVFVDNWRWDGVPFYLRSGKRMAGKGTEIVVQFKQIPHSIFEAVPKSAIPPNRLELRIQPDEGIAVSFVSKVPGPKFCMATLDLDFAYREVFGSRIQDAYQRLLLDCMNGDQTLFVRQDNIEASWAFLDGILNKWAVDKRGGLNVYPAGTWGPEAADKLMGEDGREWKTP